MPEFDERVLLAQQRTQLANERNWLASIRTFLAWTRTGLASVGFGLAIIRFLTFHNYAHLMAAQAVGCILVILGVLIFLLSLFDYRRSYIKLNVKDVYAGSMAFISLMTGTLVLVSLVLLVIAFKSNHI